MRYITLYMKVMQFEVYFLIYRKCLIRYGTKVFFLKLKQNGISDKLFKYFRRFLRNRKQRVVFNGQTSNWENTYAGVPQGSILGPLLFLIYINDLAVNLSSNPKLFADDTSLFSAVDDLNFSAI